MKSKLLLPTGSIGVTFKGKPATIKGTTEGSPMTAVVKEGQVVTQVIVPNEVSITGPIDTSTLVKTLKHYGQTEGRVIGLSGEVASKTVVWRVALPAGTIGVSFKGIPPTVSKISEESAIAHKVALDLQVIELIIPGVGEFSELTAMDLGNLLKEHKDTEGRVLVLKQAPAAPDAPSN